MIHRVLRIGSWTVDFLFTEKRYDADGVLSVLYECGATRKIMHSAERIMDSKRLNTGFTFTDQEKHRAVVVVGPTSSGNEFIDTLVHEIHHLAVAIASGLGIDLEGETPAYLSGDTARELAKVICDMGCSYRE